MNSWEWVPYLHHLSYLSDGGTVDILTNAIMLSLVEEGRLSYEDIASKLVCFGTHGISTFQGPKTGVTTQIREKWAPFVISTNYANHRINLIVETLSQYPMVS